MRFRTELKRKLRKQLGTRLEQLRETLGLSRNKMAVRLDVHRGTLQRNEDGKALPEISTLLKLSDAMDVSMDWLLFNKGPMFLKQKTDEEQNKPVHNCMDALPPDYRELLEYMDKIPVLRYEILLEFRKFLKDNKDSPDHTTPTD